VGVVELGFDQRIVSARRYEDVCRSTVVQCLMGPVIIVFLAKAVEPALLCL
jgi:hypothetical protein